MKLKLHLLLILIGLPWAMIGAVPSISFTESETSVTFDVVGQGDYAGTSYVGTFWRVTFAGVDNFQQDGFSKNKQLGWSLFDIGDGFSGLNGGDWKLGSTVGNTAWKNATTDHTSFSQSSAPFELGWTENYNWRMDMRMIDSQTWNFHLVASTVTAVPEVGTMAMAAAWVIPVGGMIWYRRKQVSVEEKQA